MTLLPGSIITVDQTSLLFIDLDVRQHLHHGYST